MRVCACACVRARVRVRVCRGIQPIGGQGKKGTKCCFQSAILLEKVSKRYKKENNKFVKVNTVHAS